MDNKEKVKSISIQHDISLLEGLKTMDEQRRKLLLVFKADVFLNILTIGDIQRAIINNLSLNEPVEKVLRNDTIIMDSTATYEEIRSEMLRVRAECMPVLDKKKKLVNIYFWEDVFPSQKKRIVRDINLPVVIMAGGKGSRMKPLTNVIPKPLIPTGEKTIVENIMDRFKAIGCRNFHLSVNYKAEIIKYYFSNPEHQEYSISFVQEEKPLGTAGSLTLLKDKISSTFFISNCDILIEEDYGEIYNYHVKNKNEITVVAALIHYPIPYGTITTRKDGILEELNEKPELVFKINSGMYLLEPHLLKEIPENQFFHITELIDHVKRRNGKVGVFPVSSNSWKDIGEWDKYLSFLKKE